MQIYTGDSIAEFLTYYDTPCTFISVDIAPQVLTYHFNLTELNKFKHIKNALSMLSMEMQQDVEQAKSDKAHFAVRIPRKKREIVETTRQGSVLKTAKPYSVLFGKDETNSDALATIQSLPHLLVAGTTGSGKSVALDSFIMQLACYNKPNDLGLVLIDLKQCEFNIFKTLPHLLTGVVNDSERAESVLSALIVEMEERYKKMATMGIDKNNGTFRPVVCVIDELAELVLQNPKCKDLLVRLLQKARACDIHIIVATQSPRAKILDGLILANLPSRLALTCASFRESMLILGHGGAEKLTGCGDAILQLNGDISEKRIQVPFISKEQIQILLGGQKI